MVAVAITFIWSVFGTNTIIFITGMATLDREVYEAARVDGASGFTTFRKITIPMLMRFIQFAFILTLITAFTALFSLIFIMTGGGPGLRHHDARVLRLPAGLPGGRVRLRRGHRDRAVRGRVRDQHRAAAALPQPAGLGRRRWTPSSGGGSARLLMFAILCVVGVVMLFPFVLMILTSFRS